MGTTSEKLTYLNGTKQLLKDKINNLGGSIDDNTTFRNYANQLQNVYDNLPKTEYQEGTEINLGVTSKGKLDYENGVVGIGDTEQDSTQGYNLINASLLPVSSNGFTITRDNNGNIIINGTPNYSSGYKNIVLGTATTLQSGTYTASVQNKIDGIGLDVGGFGGSLNLVMSGTTSSKTSSSSQAEECILSINVRSDVGTLTNFVLNPMVVSGAVVKDYEQYTRKFAFTFSKLSTTNQISYR